MLNNVFNLVILGIDEAGTVRITGVNSPFMGRVEVFHEDQWGTVCDDDWGDVDAVVLCNELGLTSGTALPGVIRSIPSGGCCSANVNSAIPGVPQKAERLIFVSLIFENIAYFDFIR